MPQRTWIPDTPEPQQRRWIPDTTATPKPKSNYPDWVPSWVSQAEKKVADISFGAAKRLAYDLPKSMLEMAPIRGQSKFFSEYGKDQSATDKANAELESQIQQTVKSPWALTKAAANALDPTGAVPGYIGLGEQGIQDIKTGNYGGAAANVGLMAAPFLIGRGGSKVSTKSIPPELLPKEPAINVVPPVKPPSLAQVPKEYLPQVIAALDKYDRTPVKQLSRLNPNDIAVPELGLTNADIASFHKDFPGTRQAPDLYRPTRVTMPGEGPLAVDKPVFSRTQGVRELPTEPANIDIAHEYSYDKGKPRIRQVTQPAGITPEIAEAIRTKKISGETIEGDWLSGDPLYSTVPNRLRPEPPNVTMLRGLSEGTPKEGALPRGRRLQFEDEQAYIDRIKKAETQNKPLPKVEQPKSNLRNLLGDDTGAVDWRAIFGVKEPKEIPGAKGRVAQFPRNINEILKAHDQLGFDTLGEAKAAIRQHEDWASRWQVDDPQAVKEINIWKSQQKPIEPSYWETLKRDIQARNPIKEPAVDLSDKDLMARYESLKAEKKDKRLAATTREEKRAISDSYGDELADLHGELTKRKLIKPATLGSVMQKMRDIVDSVQEGSVKDLSERIGASTNIEEAKRLIAEREDALNRIEETKQNRIKRAEEHANIEKERERVYEEQRKKDKAELEERNKVYSNRLRNLGKSNVTEFPVDTSVVKEPVKELPVVEAVKSISTETMQSKIDKALQDFESKNVSGGLMKPGDPKKIVIPEIGMTEQDVQDLRAVRYNKKLKDSLPSGGDFSQKFKKTFPAYADTFGKVVGWNEGAVSVELKDGRGVTVNRDDVVNFAIPEGKVKRPEFKTVMRPEKFDREGNFIIDPDIKLLHAGLNPIEGLKELFGKKEKQPKGEGLDTSRFGNAFRGKFMEDNPAFKSIMDKLIKARSAGEWIGKSIKDQFSHIKDITKEQLPEFQSELAKGNYPEVRDFFDELHNIITEKGLKLGKKENYLPQIWDNTEAEVRQAFGNKQLNEKASFQFKSFIEDYQTGIAKGLKPKMSPLELMEWYAKRANKLIADTTALKGLKEEGYLVDSKGRQEGMKPVHTDESSYAGHFAEPEVKKVIENYLSSEEGIGTGLKKGTRKVANLMLSSGVIPNKPLGTWHGSNMAWRAFKEAGFKRLGQAVKYGVSPESASKLLSEKSSRIAEITKKYGFNTTVEGTHNAPLFEGENLGKVKKGLNWLSDKQQGAFEKPLFEKMIPALKYSAWEENFANFKKKGMSEVEAGNAATKVTDDFYSGKNLDLLYNNKNFNNFMSIATLAPDWLRSTKNLGIEIPKSLAKELTGKSTPASRVYSKAAGRVMATYVFANLLQKATSGHYMVENGSDKMFNFELGEDVSGKKTRSFKLFGSAADFFKIPIQMAMAAKERGGAGLDVIADAAEARLSPLGSIPLSAITGENYKGDPNIFARTGRFGQPVSTGEKLKNTFNQVLGYGPPQAAAPLSALFGFMTPEEAVSRIAELPLSYGKKKSNSPFNDLKLKNKSSKPLGTLRGIKF